MRTILMCIVATVLSLGQVRAADPKPIMPDRNWVAVMKDEKLKNLAPKAGFLTDQASFEKLWKAWRPEEKVPQIDFKKYFVLVTLASGPNRPGLSATLDEGNLKVTAFQTLIGGPGFGYSLAQFPREGIKTIMGKKLPAAK